jgi:hypothetical protein
MPICANCGYDYRKADGPASAARVAAPQKANRSSRLYPVLLTLAILAVLLAAGAYFGQLQNAQHMTASTPEQPRAVEAPVAVTGATDTGASSSFTLAGGSYEVAWTTTAGAGGCAFSLFLATTVDGPTVESGMAILSEAKAYSDKFEWTGVPAGTYVLQEDRSGLANCTGPWSATLTAR